MKLFDKSQKQDIKKLCANISKVIEYNMIKKLERKNSNNSHENTMHTIKEENNNNNTAHVQQIRTIQSLKNESDIIKDCVPSGAVVKAEKNDRSLSTNIVFNGHVKNHKSDVKDEYPLHFGIRSYLHNFYDPPDKEVMNSGEFSQDDFLMESTKRNYSNCLFQTALWIGINLTIFGITIVLIGNLVPARNTIAGYQDNLQVLDYSAITFNHNLELCRFIGFIIFCTGSVVVIIIIFVSKMCIKKEPTYYYVLGATVMPEMFIGNPLVGTRQINGTVLSVRNIINKSKQ